MTWEEFKFGLGIAGIIIGFFAIRSFLRNPKQFTVALAIRAALLMFSIAYFLIDNDIIQDDENGLLGYADDIGLIIGLGRYIRMSYPFPTARNQKDNDELDENVSE